MEKKRFPFSSCHSSATRRALYRICICLSFGFPGIMIAQQPSDQSFINSLGMKMMPVRAGQFRMGNDGEIDYKNVLRDEIHTAYLGKGSPNPYIKDGPPVSENPLEWDEHPAHPVKITQAFYMASTPVTNAQYEQFRPEHRALRGKSGFSKNDNDAVVFVSWEDAVAFTNWLSKKEDATYRLPTEAEWEYAARAGTVTPYFTGDSLPELYRQHQVMNRSHFIAPDSVNLEVGLTPPNAWGLHDMHGIVEEWCLDWYGPYKGGLQTDPTGWASGVSRVTRGGSHSTGLPFLRSANRMGALPGSRLFVTGFRVVKGKMPAGKPIDDVIQPKWAQHVIQKDFDWNKNKVSATKPVFETPNTFTRIPPGANGPLYFIHNHEPSLSVLPNGDLLAIWFTTVLERGRDMVIAGARLRRGAKEWDEPDIFFKVPDRNMTGQVLWWDGAHTIYHLSGVGIGDTWVNLSMVMRKSTDNGVTWTKPEIIEPEYGARHQLIDGMIKTSDGTMMFLCDASSSADIGGSALHASKDGGKTWYDPGEGKPNPVFKAGNSGNWVAGRHAVMVELKDGSLLALGRGDTIAGKMPMSISKDGGQTWQYSAGPFPSVQSAQRMAFIRLQEGPLLLLSFEQEMTDMVLNGKTSKGVGMYAALSYDEGKTWPVRKLVTPGKGERVLDAPCNLRWGKKFSVLNKDHAELRGYLSAKQSPDGMIHVLSSGTHYAFNLAWITAQPD